MGWMEEEANDKKEIPELEEQIEREPTTRMEAETQGRRGNNH